MAASGAASVAIDVTGVSQVFQVGQGRRRTEVRALDAVDLRIAPGEFIAIVGPSGCGKSTLLKIIAGLLPATSGAVTVAGRAVRGPQTDLGVVFQSPVLPEWRSVIDNVLLQLELRGLNPGEYRDRARALLAKVGLEEFAERHPRELSGGMRQRAAIVRALIHDPPLLMMDEPFGALDALTREQMRLDLEQLWIEGKKTVVFVTHSIDEAVLLADRVVVMSPRPGRIEREIRIELDRPRGLEARRSPQFAAATETITEIFLSRGVLHRS